MGFLPHISSGMGGRTCPRSWAGAPPKEKSLDSLYLKAFQSYAKGNRTAVLLYRLTRFAGYASEDDRIVELEARHREFVDVTFLHFAIAINVF